MPEDTQYTSLKALTDDSFTVKSVDKDVIYKKWDDAEKKYVTSDGPEKGFSKKYVVQTDKGQLELGIQQFGSLLEATFSDGKADVNNKTFEVKSNGKTGIDVRYFLNLTTPGRQGLKEAIKETDRKHAPDVAPSDLEEPLL